jgi:hypothetical protein
MEIPSVVSVNINGVLTDVVIRSVQTTAFANCKATSIVLPSSIKEIGNNAFESCPNLKSVVIKSDTENYNVTETDENGTITPGNVYTAVKSGKTTYGAITPVIGDSIFQGCTALESVEIAGFQTIGSSIFEGCSSLKNVSLDFSGLSSVNSSTGKVNKTALTGTMGDYCFKDCTSLESVTLPDNLKSVGAKGFFEGCSALKTVNIGLDLSSGLSVDSFTGCSSLEAIHVAGEDADPYSDNSGDNSWNKSYRSIDGVLYSGVAAKGATTIGEDGTNVKDENGKEVKTISVTNLIAYPAAKKDTTYKAPDTLTSIAANVFVNNAYVQTVVIDTTPTYNKSGVKTEKKVTIGKGAFAGSTALQSVTINNICDISDSAFDGCTQLSELIHNKAEGTVQSKMGNYAFRNCALTNTELEYWASIGQGAFYGNNALTSLTLGATIGEIGNNAFEGCTSLTDVDTTYCTMAIDGDQTWGTGIFKNCTALKSVKLPLALVSLGNDTFNGCSSLTDVEFGENVATIGSNAFANCTSLESIAPSRFLVNIYSNAFSGCTKLSSITLTRSVKSIDDEAFANCKALKKVLTPAGSYAETYAKQKKYTVENIDNDIVDADFFQYDWVTLGKDESVIEGYDPAYIVLTDGVYKLYSITGYRGGFEKLTFSEASTPYVADSFISKPVEKTASMVNYLQAVDLRGIKKIGKSAFSGCKQLTTAVFDDGLTEIGSSAFSNCEKLCSSALWEMSDPRIGESGDITFSDVMAYSLVIPAGCTSVGGSAFSGCKAIRVLDMSAVSGSIADSAFKNCTALTYVKTGDGLKSIGKSAFESCTALETIELGKNITAIGEAAFKNCTSLLRVDLPYELVKIEKNTFANCTSLARVTFNKMLENIAENAFLNCTALTALTFDRNLFFEKNAFKGCTAISTIAITDASNIVSTRDPFPDSTDCTILCTDTSQATAYTASKNYNAQTVEFVDGINYVVVKVTVSVPDGITVTKADGTAVKDGDYVIVDDVLTVTAADKEDGTTAQLYVNDKAIGSGSPVEYVVKENDFSLAFKVEYAEKPSYNADVDGDGILTSNDASMVLQKVLNSNFKFTVENANPDVDGDGILSANDASNILQKVLNSNFKFPADDNK